MMSLRGLLVKIDDRLITGVQVALAQFIQLLPGLVSLQMTGSVHRHIMIWLLFSLSMLAYVLGAPEARVEFEYLFPIANGRNLSDLLSMPVTALHGVAVVVAFSYNLITLFGRSRGDRFSLSNVAAISLGAVLALLTIFAASSWVFCAVQCMFLLVMFCEYGACSKADHHRRFVAFMTSQLISLMLIATSGLKLSFGNPHSMIAVLACLIGFGLRARTFPLHHWGAEYKSRTTVGALLQPWYTVSCWPIFIHYFSEVIPHWSHAMKVIVLAFLAFGLVIVAAKNDRPQGAVSNYSIFSLPTVITAVLVLVLGRALI